MNSVVDNGMRDDSEGRITRRPRVRIRRREHTARPYR